MKQKITVYLDVDWSGNDLLDSAGNPVSAGWYLYEWPFAEPLAGPFDSEVEACCQDIPGVSPQPNTGKFSCGVCNRSTEECVCGVGG